MKGGLNDMGKGGVNDMGEWIFTKMCCLSSSHSTLLVSAYAELVTRSVKTQPRHSTVGDKSSKRTKVENVEGWCLDLSVEWHFPE